MKCIIDYLSLFALSPAMHSIIISIKLKLYFKNPLLSVHVGFPAETSKVYVNSDVTQNVFIMYKHMTDTFTLPSAIWLSYSSLGYFCQGWVVLKDCRLELKPWPLWQWHWLCKWDIRPTHWATAPQKHWFLTWNWSFSVLLSWISRWLTSKTVHRIHT